MKLLYKDQLRKLKYNKFNVISLSILVIIISLSFTMIKTSIYRLEENYEPYLEQQLTEDFYFSMGKVDVNYLGGTAIVKLCNDLDIFSQCAYNISLGTPVAYNNLNFIINERIDEHPELYEEIIDSIVDRFTSEYDYEVEKKYVATITDGDYSYKFITSTSKIDLPYLVDGEFPVEDGEIAIFKEFAELNNIELEDTFTINQQEFTVKGYFYAPDFIFPIFSMNSIQFDSQYQTLVLANYATIDSLDQHIFTKYLIRGDLTKIIDDVSYDTLQNIDRSVLGKNMQLVSILMPASINYRIITLPIEVENANVFINLFLSLFILFIIILLTIFIKRYIHKSKKDIDTLHALGYSNEELSKALMVFPIVISLMAFVGYGLGLLLSDLSFDFYSARYLFPKAEFSIQPEIFVLGTIIPIIFINVVSYIFIIFTLKEKQKTFRKIKLKLFKYTSLKTTIQTGLLFITISVMILMGLNGGSMFTSFVEKTKLGNNYYEMVNLQYLTNDLYSEDYEQYTRDNGLIVSLNETDLPEPRSTHVYGIDPTNSLKLLINNDVANNSLLEEGFIISSYLKERAGLKIGDLLTVSIGQVEVTQEIVGISNELIESTVFMNVEDMNLVYNLDSSYYNGLYITDNFYDNDFILSRINYQSGMDQFISLLNLSSIIVYFILTLSVLLGLFIFGLIIINFIEDEKINIAILKAIGYFNHEINMKYLLQLYIFLVISYIAMIPFTQFLLDLMLKNIMDTIGFNLVIEMSFLNIVIGFIALHIIFGLTVYFITKQNDKLSLSSILVRNIK